MTYVQAENPTLHIARGTSKSLTKCQTKAIKWAKRVEELSNPPRGDETLVQFLRLPKDQQTELKGAAGWIVGGPVANNWRKRMNVTRRDLLTFDVDAATPEMLESLQDGTSPLCAHEFVAYSTRRHTTEEPRIRIERPASSTLCVELYEPVGRILAGKLDPSLEAFDPKSFESSQLMFNPTLSADSDYVLIHNHGDLLDPDEVLEGWHGDWQDFSQLPHCASRATPRARGLKVEDPHSKPGAIGAFNRAFSITEAIERFLPEVYVPGDDAGGQTRWSYLDGSGTSGAVEYEGGKFLFSHHASDPAGERLVNAFDLVRVHKFEDLDVKSKEGAAPGDLPSFKEMQKFAKSLPEVTEELATARYDYAAMFDDLPDCEDDDEAGEEPLGDSDPDASSSRRRLTRDGWRDVDLDYDTNGKLRPTLHNATVIIANDPRTREVVAMNEFTNRVTAKASLKSGIATVKEITVRDAVNGEPWQDLHDYSIRAILEAPAGDGKPGWGFPISDRDVRQAIRLSAELNRFHPIKGYYEALIWDGVPRVETLWIDWLGMPDTPYARETARMFLLAAVARIYCPGHKFDFIPIISGAQGVRKSTFVKALFGEWAGELTAEMTTSKDAIEQMLGLQCLELPELTNLRKGEVNAVKAFTSRTVDRVRLSYDARMSTFHRQCVFIGTDNDGVYLHDQSGNRRFWPLEVGVDLIDTDGLATVRDQLWAEAYYLYQVMGTVYDIRALPLYLRGTALAEAERRQALALHDDPDVAIAAAMEAALDDPRDLSDFLDPETAGSGFTDDDAPKAITVRTCAREAYCLGTGLGRGDIAKSRALQIQSGKVMQHVEGWRRTGRRVRFPGHGRAIEYVRDDATPQELERGYRMVS
ncbi:MAG: VapE domain-containing protein [Paracoccaceae bacterium]